MRNTGYEYQSTLYKFTDIEHTLQIYKYWGLDNLPSVIIRGCLYI